MNSGELYTGSITFGGSLVVLVSVARTFGASALSFAMFHKRDRQGGLSGMHLRGEYQTQYPADPN